LEKELAPLNVAFWRPVVGSFSKAGTWAGPDFRRAKVSRSCRCSDRRGPGRLWARHRRRWLSRQGAGRRDADRDPRTMERAGQRHHSQTGEGFAARKYSNRFCNPSSRAHRIEGDGRRLVRTAAGVDTGPLPRIVGKIHAPARQSNASWARHAVPAPQIRQGLGPRIPLHQGPFTMRSRPKRNEFLQKDPEEFAMDFRGSRQREAGRDLQGGRGRQTGESARQRGRGCGNAIAEGAPSATHIRAINRPRLGRHNGAGTVVHLCLLWRFRQQTSGRRYFFFVREDGANFAFRAGQISIEAAPAQARSPGRAEGKRCLVTKEDHARAVFNSATRIVGKRPDEGRRARIRHRIGKICWPATGHTSREPAPAA